MLAQFTDKSGKTVWINAFMIRDIRPKSWGAQVYYGSGKVLRVTENAESIAQRVNDAMLSAMNPAAFGAVMTSLTDEANAQAAAAAAG